MMLLVLLLLAIALLFWANSGTGNGHGFGRNDGKDHSFWMDHFLRSTMSRKQYYREVYLKSEAWKRKRHVVLKRDNWTCVYCSSKATQVHHTQYARHNIGKEPIHWLVSVCKNCHEKLHG